MSPDEGRQLLYGVVIGQTFTDTVFDEVGLPSEHRSLVRGVVGDIKRLHDDGDHRGARLLASEWGEWVASHSKDVPKVDDRTIDDILEQVPM